MTSTTPILAGYIVGSSIANLIITHDIRWWVPSILGILIVISLWDFGTRKKA